MNVFIKRAGFLALSAPHHEIAPDKRGGFNGSLQHWLAVSWPESQTPKSFEDVDLTAAQLCRVQLVYSRTSPSFSQPPVGVFVGAALPRALRIAEVHFHIRGHCEGLVFGHLQPAVPGQRAPQGGGEFPNVPAQRSHIPGAAGWSVSVPCRERQVRRNWVL